MDDLEPNIAERITASFARQKLMAAYRAKITGLAKGNVEVTVLPLDFLMRSAGSFHGGVIAALADTAAAYAAGTMQPQDTSFLTVEFKINFLNQARGEKLITRARILKNGNTLIIAQADIFTGTNGEETLVATALLTLIRVNK
jgi:uncharacterized protein (TIGR00369 family)